MATVNGLTRPMPITDKDLADIRSVANMASTEPIVFSAQLCRTGALLRTHSLYISDAIALLRASGYTATHVKGRILVTGAIDRVALLVAERDRLTAEIAALEAETAVATR